MYKTITLSGWLYKNYTPVMNFVYRKHKSLLPAKMISFQISNQLRREFFLRLMGRIEDSSSWCGLLYELCENRVSERKGIKKGRRDKELHIHAAMSLASISSPE